MGMGSGQGQQPQGGMSGKGGAQTTTPQQPQQPAQGGVAGKGGAARPNPAVFNTANGPQGGMQGKGGSSYPFPQPQVQQSTQPTVQPGMGGKGMGRIPPDLIPKLQEQMQIQNQNQPGMGGKGLGLAPQAPLNPDQKAGMGGKGAGQIQYDPTVMDSFRPPTNTSSPSVQLGANPATDSSFATYARQMAQTQAPGMTPPSYDQFMADRLAGQAQPIQQPKDYGFGGGSNTALPQVQAPQVMPAPIKPAVPARGPSNMVPAPVMTKSNQQQIKAEAKQQQLQRALQQLAAKAKAKGKR